MRKKILSILILSAALTSGCSVVEASRNDGVRQKDISACSSKTCFLSLGAESLEKKELADGKTKEIYRVKRRKHNSTYARAIFHGAADVFTLGLWEFVATPIEGYMSNDRFIVFQATYNQDDSLDKLEIQGKS